MDATARTTRTLLANLVKAALMSEDRASALWREEAAQAQAALAARPGAAAALKLDGLWSLAVREAEAPDLRDTEGQVSFGLPVACPFSLDELTRPNLDIDAAVERIRKSAATAEGPGSGTRLLRAERPGVAPAPANPHLERVAPAGAHHVFSRYGRRWFNAGGAASPLFGQTHQPAPRATPPSPPASRSSPSSRNRPRRSASTRSRRPSTSGARPRSASSASFK